MLREARRRRLVIGLGAAGALAAGFGSGLSPAAAEPRTLLVTLVGGKQITPSAAGGACARPCP